MKHPPKARLVVLTVETHTGIALKHLRDARRIYVKVETEPGCWQRIDPIQAQANVIRQSAGKSKPRI
jgi:hypothetical protein